jgi:predicted dehydrogenase
MERRQFLKNTARAGVATIAAASAKRVYGANSRVNIALIGCGGRGKSVARHIAAVEGVDYVGMCDVYDKQAMEAKKAFGGTAKIYKDFRQVLENKDIDAVHIATPDHWHAIPTVMACQAGKHVYVEKPYSHNVVEGRAMVNAAKESKAVFLTGTQHRSGEHFAECAEIIRSGKLANVNFVKVWNYVNLAPSGIGTQPDSDPPEGLDWDFYLGPAPKAPFNPLRFLRTYRSFWDYSGGWITDFGIHRFDSVHQIMGVDQPTSVCATGGRFTVGGMGEHPDVLQVTYEYPGFVMSYESLNMNSFGAMGRTTPGMTLYSARGDVDRPNGMAFYGTNGVMIVDRLGYEIVGEEESRRTPFRAEGDTSGKSRGAKIERFHMNEDEPTPRHGQHFVRCIRDGEKPNCNALDGHHSSLIAHLGNIAFKTGRKLKWDAVKEEFTGDPEASKLLGRKARKPWDMISI